MDPRQELALSELAGLELSGGLLLQPVDLLATASASVTTQGVVVAQTLASSGGATVVSLLGSAVAQGQVSAAGVAFVDFYSTVVRSGVFSAAGYADVSPRAAYVLPTELGRGVWDTRIEELSLHELAAVELGGQRFARDDATFYAGSIAQVAMSAAGAAAVLPRAARIVLVDVVWAGAATFTPYGAVVLSSALNSQGFSTALFGGGAVFSALLLAQGASSVQWVPPARLHAYLDPSYYVTIRLYEDRTACRFVEVRSVARPPDARGLIVPTEDRVATWS